MLVAVLLKGCAGPASAQSPACTDQPCKEHLPRSGAEVVHFSAFILGFPPKGGEMGTEQL